jgi:hypothetical protein
VEELVLAEILAEYESLFCMLPIGLHIIVNSQHLLMVFQTPLCNIVMPVPNERIHCRNCPEGRTSISYCDLLIMTPFQRNFYFRDGGISFL